MSYDIIFVKNKTSNWRRDGVQVNTGAMTYLTLHSTVYGIEYSLAYIMNLQKSA